jgi:hypothetical protein
VKYKKETKSQTVTKEPAKEGLWKLSINIFIYMFNLKRWVRNDVKIVEADFDVSSLLYIFKFDFKYVFI